MAETGDEKPGPEPKVPQTPAPPQPRRRHLVFWVAILVMLVIAVPAAILACLARVPEPFELRLVKRELGSLACPSNDAVFPDCYASVVATVTNSPQPEVSFINSCCSFLGDRRLSAEIWLNFAHSATMLSATGETALGVVRIDREVTGDIPISVSHTFERILPWADQFLGQGQSARILAGMDDWALRMPLQLSRYWPRDEGVADTVLTVPTGRPTVEVSAFADGTKRFHISVKTDIAQTVLFPEAVDLNSDLSGLGARLADFPLPSPAEIAARIQKLGKSTSHRSMDAPVLAKVALTIQALGGMSVSRHPRVSGSADEFELAGAQCVNLYRNLRSVVSRLDAALATYASALPTGLLLRHAGERDHGCEVAGSVLGVELDRAWQRLNLNLPVLAEIDSVKEKGLLPTPDPRTMDSYLLTIASVAKSGARHADLEAVFYPKVEVRVGRNGPIEKRERSQVLRLLHRQWTHIGCWHYDQDEFSLHAEAQFPYLNQLTFRRGGQGLVTGVKVTGVTFSQLERVRRTNRGANCQAFLNPIRMKHYQNWLSHEAIGAHTPIDHARRLLDIGPQKRFQLPIR